MRTAFRIGLLVLLGAGSVVPAAPSGAGAPLERVLAVAEGLRPGQLPRAIRFMEGEVIVDASQAGAVLALLPEGRGAALERDDRIRLYRAEDAQRALGELAATDPWRAAVIKGVFAASDDAGPLPAHQALTPPAWWELMAPDAAAEAMDDEPDTEAEAVDLQPDAAAEATGDEPGAAAGAGAPGATREDGAPDAAALSHGRGASRWAGRRYGRPVGADWQNTSEFFAGRISLNLLLPESDGRIEADRETWRPEEEGLLLGETMRALADLAELFAEGEPRFVLHLLSGRTDGRLATGLEPIAGVLGGAAGDGPERWGNEILEHFGVTEGDFLARSRWFADITRRQDGSDWAVNAFVVRAEEDEDGAFADGREAQAWLGGPHFVLSSRGGAARTEGRTPTPGGEYRHDDPPGHGGATPAEGRTRLLRHLLLHAFHALDQREGCRCGQASGYLAAGNLNCGGECGTIRPDVMTDGRLTASPTTRAQLGLGDSDADGLPDLFDMDPELQLDPGAEGVSCDGLVLLRGVARVSPFPNLNPANSTPRQDIVLGRIDRIEIRVDNGDWQRGLVYAADGEFDGPEEVFEAGIALRSGRHHIELRAIDDHGNVSRGASRAADVAERAVPVGASLVLRSSSAGPTLRWREAPGAASYRVLRAKDPAALETADPVLSLATTSWADPSPGVSFYRVVSVDGCGRPETTPQK